MRHNVLAALGTATLVTGALAAMPLSAVAGPVPLHRSVTSTHSDEGCHPLVTVLPDLGYGGESVAFAHGVVVGAVATSTGHFEAAWWRHGRLSLITDRRFTDSEVMDINGSGELVGMANGGQAWYKMPHSRIHLLPDAPAGDGSYMYARRINQRGQIAGAAVAGQYAVRWNPPYHRAVVLRPARGDTSSWAKGINNRGDVAGDSDVVDPTTGVFVPHPAVWDRRGRVRVFPSGFVARRGQVDGGDIFEINNRRQSVGESWLGTADTLLGDEATRWSATGSPQLLGFLPGDSASVALGLSTSGEVAGISFQLGDDSSQHHVFVWPGHGPLKTLPVPGVPYLQSESFAHQIEHGTVAGAGGRLGETLHPLLWHCAFRQAFIPPADSISAHPASHAPGLTLSRAVKIARLEW
jgi:uncharacterized membrane protein